MTFEKRVREGGAAPSRTGRGVQRRPVLVAAPLRSCTVNNQLDRLIDVENGALGTPPDLPLQLVGVSLEEALGR